MTLKRDRNAQVANPAAVVEGDAVGEPSRSTVLTIGYPIRVVDFNWWKFGGFLERCDFCTKRIAPAADVFMYRNLRAFCTAECREIQIEIDRMAKQQRAKAKEIVVRNQGFTI